MSGRQPEPGETLPLAAPVIPVRIARSLPAPLRAELSRLPAAQQAAFVEAFRAQSKSLLLAYLTSLLYCHYAMLGRWAMSGLMLLSLFLAAAVGWIWWLIDVVRMPQMVREHNHRIALEILRGLATASEPAPLSGA